MDRDYVQKENSRFQPTELGFLVNDLMVASFGDIVDVGYTARMEEELDRIEEGDLHWTDALREFQKKFEVDLARARKEMRDVKREAIPTDQSCDKCGKPMVLKWGRFGQFLACSGYPECKNTRDRAADGENGNGDRADMAAAAKAARSRVGAEPRSRPRPIPARSAASRWCSGGVATGSSWPARVTRTARRRARSRSPRKARPRPRSDSLLDEICPRCGSRLAIKQGRYGEFTACSNYPKCRYVKMKETGRELPRVRQGAVGRAAQQARQAVLRLQLPTRTAISSSGGAR